ncbi:MAG: vWA domain-containing protein [Thermoanaerobaculia bacterium]
MSAPRRLAIALFFACAGSVFAGDGVAPGIDLVVLVDCSASTATTIRASHRETVAMVLRALTHGVETTRLAHRLAVMRFGSSVRRDIPLTSVAQREQLQAGIEKLDVRSLGRTDFVAALRAAAAEFRSLPPAPGRRRAILLLTDGEVSAPGAGARAAQAAIQQLVSKELADVSLDVVIAGETKSPFWERVAGKRVRFSGGDDRELLATIHGVITNVLGTRGTDTILRRPSESLVIPPYLELIVFDVFRGEARRNVAIVPPDSEHPLTTDSTGVEQIEVSPTLTTVIVRRPAAGAWTFRKDDPAARVRVLSQQFFPRGFLLTPPLEPRLRQHDSTVIRYRLTDGAGQSLRAIPGFPLSVEVAVTYPDERREAVAMTREFAAVYRSVNKTSCALPGRYWTEVHVLTRDGAGHDVRVLEDRWSGFSVEAGEREPLLQSTAATVVAPQPRARTAVLLQAALGKVAAWPAGAVSYVIWAAAAGGVLLLVLRGR